MDNNQLDAASLMDWLDKRIETQKQLKATDVFNSQIKTSITHDYIQLYSGIDIVADILDQKLEEDEKIDAYFVYYFWYKGTKIFQLSTERLV